jgi:NAD(P)-dependent dehydrogenase (short-subunit alcohol dehydrogenase family)
MKLIDKVAIITGAGSGIGQAAAILFTLEGARVVVADISAQGGRDTVAQIIARSGQAIAVEVDVSQSSQVRSMVHTAVDTHGRLDILFNNAGTNLAATVTETSEEEWERVMAVNVRGVFLGCKYAIPVMIANGGDFYEGIIINTSSAAGMVGLRGLAAYTASKGAVLRLTRNIALDCAEHNIRANALCPGVTQSPMTLAVIQSQQVSEAMRKRMDSGRPLGRMAEPEEMARSALFLASDDSSFMTGAPLIVDGSYTAE